MSETPGRQFDQASIQALLTRDYPGLRLLLIRRAHDEALASDLLNDAICTTLQKWRSGEIRQPELICGYVFQVALNLLRNHRRSHGERPELRASTEALEDVEGAQRTDLAAAEAGIAARVREFLQKLGTARDRLIIKRFYLDEEDKSAICRDLKLDPMQFDRVLHRARGRLRELIEHAGLGRNDFFSLAFL